MEKQAHWPEWADDVVERIRFTDDGRTWWELAAAKVPELPADQQTYLATLELAELIAQVHRVNREPGYVCAGPARCTRATRSSRPRVTTPSAPDVSGQRAQDLG